MLRRLYCLLSLATLGLTVSTALGLQEDLIQEEGQALADTALLAWSETDLSERLMDGAHRFVERQIDESIESHRGQVRFLFFHTPSTKATPSPYLPALFS